MQTFLLVALGIILFQLLVVLHEYGHFLVAKRNGVEVEEFGLGFPPRMVGKVMGKGIFRSLYTINWLPLGGFVKLKGENDTAKGKGTYGSQRLWVKTKIILAGVVVNFLTAIALFTLLALIGIPRLLPTAGFADEEQFTIASDTTIASSTAITSFVADDSPADAAGLQLGDKLISLAGQNIDTNMTLGNLTPQLAGQTVDLVVERDGGQLTLAPTLRTQEVIEASVVEREQCLAAGGSSCSPAMGYLGVVATDFVLQKSTWSAPITGVGLALQYSKVTLQGLWTAVSALFAGDTTTASESVSGPVGIFFILKEGANLGFRFILMIIAIISLTLAIMNTLPIPALDGGRLMLTVLFRKILKKPLTKDTEEKIVGSSMAMLLLLMLVITVVDIRRFF